jgi:hypothetical protein
MPTFLERTTVSRKTPRDGKLEITSGTAARLERVGAPLHVEVTGRRAPAVVTTITCTCRGEGDAHAHHFVQSDLLKELPVGGALDLEVDDPAAAVIIRLESPSP